MRSNSTTRRPSVQRTCIQCGQSHKVFAFAADKGYGKFCNRFCQRSYETAQLALKVKAMPVFLDISLGYCQCGCNQKTSIARQTDNKRGLVKGQPIPFIRGHNTRVFPNRKPTKHLAVDRFWPKVDKYGPISDYRPDLGSCWIWTGSTSVGYGTFYDGNRLVGAHRFSYELHIGPVPETLVLDHLCRVPSCVNPDHLEAVKEQVNLLRGISPPAQNARKIHCPYCGNPYDSYDERGWRRCKTCAKELRKRKYRERKEEQSVLM